MRSAAGLSILIWPTIGAKISSSIWLLYAYSIVVLQITAFIAVAGVLVILAWIGWTMATTPPPAPLEPEPVTTSVGTEEKASA
jgi:predicted DNA-binding transcriptional regulator